MKRLNQREKENEDLRSPGYSCYLSYGLSCKDDDVLKTNYKIYGTWEATSFISIESVTYQKNYNPRITFTRRELWIMVRYQWLQWKFRVY